MLSYTQSYIIVIVRCSNYTSLRDLRSLGGLHLHLFWLSFLLMLLGLGWLLLLMLHRILVLVT